MKRMGTTKTNATTETGPTTTNSKKISVASQSSGTRRSSLTNHSNHSTSSRQKKAGMYVLILLLILTFSWLSFIVLIIHDFHVHHSDIQGQLRLNNCSDEEQVSYLHSIEDFPILRYVAEISAKDELPFAKKGVQSATLQVTAWPRF